MPPGRAGNLFLPFFHLKSDGFWHLIPQHEKEGVLAAIGQIRSAAQLRETVLGAQLDNELYELGVSNFKQTRTPMDLPISRF